MDPPEAQATRAGGGDLAGALAEARSRLREKLRRVDVAGLGLSPYNQRYLGHKLALLDAELRRVCDLLALCLRGRDAPLAELTLLDYGGGSGIISLLARELGVGTVIYDDVYDVSCDDAARLAAAVGLPLEHVVCGDVDVVVAYLRAESLELDAAVSYDVLEHIYDVPAFLRTLATAPLAPSFRLVFGSGANIRNRRYVRTVTEAHVRCELQGTEPEWGHKERDAVRPYLEIRRELVAVAAPQLTQEEVAELARATRGLRQDDVARAVAEYVEQGSVSYRPDHPTNTCDPYTGNWAEHLMEPAWLVRAAGDAGFAAEIRAGRYAPAGRGGTNAVKRLLDVAIGAFGARALPVAPYYVLYATLR